MERIKLRSRVGKDGILHLDIPLNLEETDLEITIIVQQIQPQNESSDVEDFNQLSWPEFIERTAGSLADDPIILDKGGIDETLDDNLDGVFDRL